MRDRLTIRQRGVDGLELRARCRSQVRLSRTYRALSQQFLDSGITVFKRCSNQTGSQEVSVPA